ncbi:MAG TPA: rhodanese-like domain-containing protein [Candidatus Bilamarchaeum sp.]|nr:rhodanese-like domain-containing protein [Candidatus Bilamarchaeum sp.]
MSAKGAVKFFTEKLEYETSPSDVHRMLDEKDAVHVFVDVRDAKSFRAGHVPGAMNVPAAEMPDMLDRLPKGKTLVLYCYNIVCFAAPRAALYLAKKGYSVKELVGGFEEYEKRGHPVEKG